MAKAYNSTRCYVCGQMTSKNGLATTSHAKKHVKAGEMQVDTDGRYTPTPQGNAKAQETTAVFKALRAVMETTRRTLDETPDGSPAWTDAYTAYADADAAYKGYVNK